MTICIYSLFLEIECLLCTDTLVGSWLFVFKINLLVGKKKSLNYNHILLKRLYNHTKTNAVLHEGKISLVNYAIENGLVLAHVLAFGRTCLRRRGMTFN